MNIDERLDTYPESWRPEPGDKLIGTVAELDMLDSKFGGQYPLVIVRTDDDREIAFHAFHTVAKSELARLRPRVGERIGIAYKGRDDKVSYERYRVIVDRAETNEQTVDWQRVQEDARSELDSADIPPVTDADAPAEEDSYL